MWTGLVFSYLTKSNYIPLVLTGYEQIFWSNKINYNNLKYAQNVFHFWESGNIFLHFLVIMVSLLLSLCVVNTITITITTTISIATTTTTITTIFIATITHNRHHHHTIFIVTKPLSHLNEIFFKKSWWVQRHKINLRTFLKSYSSLNIYKNMYFFFFPKKKKKIH